MVLVFVSYRVIRSTSFPFGLFPPIMKTLLLYAIQLCRTIGSCNVTSFLAQTAFGADKLKVYIESES